LFKYAVKTAISRCA